MNRRTPRAPSFLLRCVLSIACTASGLALASARECAAGAALGAGALAAPVSARRLGIDAYAPSPLAMRTPAPPGDGRPAPGEAEWSVGPRDEADPPSRVKRWAGTGALIGACGGVAVAVVHTRGDDGLADLFEPFLWVLGGFAGAAVGGAIGGAIALATGG